ncbi:mechanosensitive ion channel domain-containing protein [Achromobacter sp. Marseille-Q4954]|uniref:mechanosensitive ion channel family protein n=1 Tax=Achromobacter sp. Marseille-Q4954 TaxID=2942203 RepID=UPI002073B7F6|nr:mechanosensitive ion channel domain-containing protein [Achromobacter sp. Marseille-Q4954]
MRAQATARAKALFGLIALLASLLGPAYAQGTATEPARPVPASTQAHAILVAEIPLRADTDHRYAESVMERITGADPTDSLAPRLESISRSVDEKLQQFQPAQLRTLPIMRLESLERHWMFDARRFADWQADMRQATAAYASDAAELARRREAWQVLKGAPGAADLPPALTARMDSVIAQLARAEQALSVPLSRQIALGQRANSVEERIQAGQRSVADAISYIDARLLELDGPPLWAATFTPTARSDARAYLRSGLDMEMRFARQYAAADTGNQLALHVLQVVLLPLLLWLAWHSRHAIRAGEMSETAARVLGRPLSAWLLLAMMGVQLLESDAPLIVLQIALLLAVVPVLRLLPPTAREQLDLWPYAITGLYLAERLGIFFLASETLYRLHNLVITLLALATALWLHARAKRRGSAAQAPGRLHQAVRIGAWAAVALLAIAGIANLVGNLSMAEMLTSAVISSGYFGLMLYAGVTIIVTLLQLMLARPGVSRFRIAREHAPPLVQLLIRLVMASAVAGWAIYTMDRFRILRATYAFTTKVLSYTLALGDITISLGNILVFAISVLIAFWAARAIRLVLHDEVLARMPLPRGVGNSIASLTYYSVLLLGLAVALSAAGVRTSQLALVLGALGVGIGFGLQNVVNNFVSGLILMFERPIQPGDVVEIGETSGQVREIGMRATRIRTFEGADVVVPNGTLLSEKLTNWTMLDRNRRIEINLGLAYGTDPAQAIELLGSVARGTLGVSTQPAPIALFMGFGASSLDFSVRAWTPDFDQWMSIRSDMLSRMYEALTRAGIEIPYPQTDLHLRSISPEAGAVLAQARRAAPDGGPPPT